MGKVMAFGTFDLLHIGHLAYLEEARKLGDELIVVVACDDSVRKEKGREPIIPQEQRRKMIESLKPVSRAVIGYPGDRLKIIRELKPGVIALGPDQKGDEKELERKLGKGIKVIRVHKYEQGWKTRSIIERIKNAGI